MKSLRTLLITLSIVLCATLAYGGFQGFNGTSNLKNFGKLKCSTGMSCSNVGGVFVMTASDPSFTMTSGEIINNTVDDTIEMTSNDEVMTFQVSGFEAKNAVLKLAADQGDDASDVFFLKSDTSNLFTIGNGTTALSTMTSTGDWVFGGTTPYLTIGDAGAEDAGVAFDGAAQDFHISLDDSSDDLVIGLGVAAGTTDAIRIDENQVVTFVQEVLGLGTDTLSGFLQKQVAATATTITAAQCGSTFISSGAIEMELPEASTVHGCRLTFVVANASAFTVDTDAGDQIMILSNAAGDAVAADAVGETLTIEAISDSQWVVIDVYGTWSDVN